MYYTLEHNAEIYLDCSSKNCPQFLSLSLDNRLTDLQSAYALHTNIWRCEPNHFYTDHNEQ